MFAMFVTEPTFQLLRSPLKLEHAPSQPTRSQYEPNAQQKRYDMSLTADTSHVLMWPYVTAAVVELVHHASRAKSSAARLLKTPWGGESGEGGGAGGEGGEGGIAGVQHVEQVPEQLGHSGQYPQLFGVQ
jgi:hypothetical protein